MRSLEFAWSISFGLSSFVGVDIMKIPIRGTEKKGRRRGKERSGDGQWGILTATCAVSR
jgi:hypothetical protein